MHGINHLPNVGMEKTKVFYPNDSGWMTWCKPTKSRFIYILCIGGGGGGGASTATRVGGGGGGSSAISIGFFPSLSLPDQLYVTVGNGGTGGKSGSAATAGGVSRVSILPSTLQAKNYLIASSNTSGGGAGSSPTGGSAGATYTSSLLSGLGFVTSISGQAGASAPATQAVGNSVAITGITTGGASGGTSSSTVASNGGNITGSGFMRTIEGGISSFLNGSGGFCFPPSTDFVKEILMFVGGAGGAAVTSGTGGTGGDGSYGCGGGGGGGGTVISPGGAGGDGIVVITSW